MSDPDAMTDELTVVAAATDPTSDFIDQSYLTYLIPSATNIDLEKAFENLDESKPILESIDQRDALFFDEIVDVLLILQTPWRPKTELYSHINRLTISLEAQIVNSSVSDRDSPGGSESIFTGSLADTSDPFIIVRGSDSDDDDDNDDDDDEDDDEDEGESRQVYAIWKLSVPLTRPRMRLHSPSVAFSASASLRPDALTDITAAATTGYLPSGLPSGFNLLESFSSDPSLDGIKPRLSALRVSRVAPVTRQQDHLTRLRALARLSIKIFPVLHTRIRFSHPNTIPASTAVTALLEIDFTPHFNCEVLLSEIKLSIPESTVEDLNGEAGMGLPLSCVSHDHVTFLYHIKPHKNETGVPKDTIYDLDISIAATVEVIPNICTPHLSMTWTTSIDFAAPVNPNFGPAAETGIQRAHRPTSLSIGAAQAVHHLKPASATRPDALPALEASTIRTETTIPDLGITMSFTAPSDPIHPGDIFSWTVYVVNRTTERATSRPPRKLAFVAIPKRRRNDVRPVRPVSSGGQRRGEKEIADAVLDENVLHAIQKNAAVESTDLICLSADTRVGPVAPGACHVVELQFLALKEGIVGLEAIRVVDLGSQEHVDVRDLPTMIVEPVVS